MVAIDFYEPFTPSARFAVHTGDCGRTSERRAKGNVTAADDPILERLMEILRFFDD